MDPTPISQPPAGTAFPSYFVWEPAGQQFAIQLGGDVVDHLNYEIMRGFGAVPKRGAEVGGLLLGSIVRGEKRVVRIEKFVCIPCEHLHGPSYILSENDLAALDREITAHETNADGLPQVVGFFRSNTRELLQLTEDDLALLDARFSGDDAICLLVRPFATRPGEAVFLTRENGRFSGEEQSGAFVFRRKEMHLAPMQRRGRGVPPEHVHPAAPEGGEAVESPSHGEENPAAEAPAARTERAADFTIPRMGSRRYPHGPYPVVRAGQNGGSAADDAAEAQPASSGTGTDRPLREAAAPPAIPWDTPPVAVRRSRWFWAPLCFVFLVLGILVGVGGAITVSRARNAANADPYRLDLGVSRFGESCHLAWNPDALAIRQAQSGELLIEEGGANQTQQLSHADLSRGGIIYRGAAAPVRFRLTVHLRNGAALSESVESKSTAQ